MGSNIIISKHQEYSSPEEVLFILVIYLFSYIFFQLTVLANFGTDLYPQALTSTENTDCIDIAHLANHILSKKPRIKKVAGVLRKKLLQINLGGEDLNITPNLDSETLDFLETCNKLDLSLLMKVSK
jgi:hypothetical protein